MKPPFLQRILVIFDSLSSTLIEFVPRSRAIPQKRSEIQRNSHLVEGARLFQKDVEI